MSYSKTVGDSVAAPIEAQINGVENTLYMTSTSSSNGQMTLTVHFTLNTDPDIAQAEQNLIGANAQIGAAKALYFPAISLTGALGTGSSDLSNLFQGPTRMWSYAGSFTGPIFTAGAIAGQGKQAEAQQKAALLF